MPPLYRLIEVAIYSLLNFLPFLALALYPFRHSLRFSRRVTAVLIALVTAGQLLLGAWAAFWSNGKAGTVSAVSTVLYALFYFLAVKKHFGKTLFTLLMISNIANFAVISGKCLEGLLFPQLALQSYRWSFSLMLLLMEGLLSIPHVFYMKRFYTPAVEKEPSGLEWRYLWLIPATFYVMWYFAFYGNSSYSSLEIALQPKNTVFLFFINVGEILIYYVVAQLILEQDKILALREQNHLLAMQAMQYENLQERITEARRAKHDVRHHIALMQQYVNDGDYAALKDYLRQYGRNLPDDALGSFCDNIAANAVLLFFAQQAKYSGVGYTAAASIPREIGVPDTEISVILGNLLENALDVCKKETSADRRIIVHASCNDNALCITVDNTCTGTLKRTVDGQFISTKHTGEGLGIRSVKSIAAQYHGVCRFEAKDGMFYASVYCPLHGRAAQRAAEI